MGYLLDEQGAVASPLAVGAKDILALANARLAKGTHAGEGVPQSGNGYTSTRFDLGDPSRTKRDALPAGTLAPGFRLPRVGAGELSLDEFRGQRVLLIFSDPECHHCHDLAPKLQELYRGEPGVQVLIVSRGRAGANRALITKAELTIPVVLQRHWEISRAYRILATPIAYLIDEVGTIAAPVAVGMDEILALALTLKPTANAAPERVAR
jgi:peroxiredoxin